jgi:hypothetical protein
MDSMNSKLLGEDLVLFVAAVGVGVAKTQFPDVKPWQSYSALLAAAASSKISTGIVWCC